MESKQLPGVEVPVIGSEIHSWIELRVPPSASTSQTSRAFPLVASLSKDAASGTLLGDPQILVTWRVHSSNPNSLELLEIYVSEHLPKTGLRLVFPSPLSPFVFTCKDEKIEGKGYILYVLCTNGRAYHIKLKNFTSYTKSILPMDQFMELDLCGYSNEEEHITAAAAANGCLIIGRNDGIVSCFHLGVMEQNNASFAHELRDDLGIGRLLGLLSRSRNMARVQDVVILEIHDQKLVFVLHSDGGLRVWDLRSRYKVGMYTLHKPYFEETVYVKICMGEADDNERRICFAVLCKGSSDMNECVFTGSFCFVANEKISLHLEHSMQIVPLKSGNFVDMKVTGEKLWILTDDCLLVNSFSRGSCRYEMNEAFIANELFQSENCSSDDLPWIFHSLGLATNEKIALFMSSIFLRRILQPGVYHSGALHETFMEYNKNWTKSEFLSLTVDEMRKEILLLVEQDGFSKSATSIFYYWKKFCARYFFNWRKHNSPHGFLVDSSTNAVALVRKSSVSLFRSLNDIELLNRGYCQFADLMSYGSDIFFGLVKCASTLSSQMFYKASSMIYYESLVASVANPTSKDIISCLLKVLRNGYSPSVTALQASDLGVDVARKKQLENHESCRKFSVNMLVSLLDLHAEGRTLLNVVEAYLTHLMPLKTQEARGSMALSILMASIFVQATAQTTKTMFEAAFNMVFFLSYLLETSGPIKLTKNDAFRIRLELLPKAEGVTLKWLIVHLLSTMPSVSPSKDDFTSKLSMLQLSGTENQIKWKKMLGRCDFSLAFILLLDNTNLSGGGVISLNCLPYPDIITSSAFVFASWIMGSCEGYSPITRASEIAVILLRNGQADAVELFLGLVSGHSHKEMSFECLCNLGDEWCILQHLLGCCFVVQAQFKVEGDEKESKLCQAVCCFFKASSITQSFEDLQRLSNEAGFHIMIANRQKIDYFQCVMQIFEQHGLSEGAFEFALAALEEVDEDHSGSYDHSETDIIVKGRFWANVFKFSLDMKRFDNAYCAIISNPDEESRCICLRRFIIVLCEHNLVKPLCEREIPFIGMEDLVVKELTWKAECSDLSAKPNLYKVLYAYEMYRHNWQQAAGCMYRLYNRLRIKDEMEAKQNLSEQIDTLSATINALQHTQPAFTFVCSTSLGQPHSKKMRTDLEFSYFGIEDLQKEFVVLSAEYLLLSEDINWRYAGKEELTKLISMLTQFQHYDMALTVVLKFFKGSLLKKEMERVFISMALNCCQNDNALHLIPIDTTLNNVPPEVIHVKESNWEVLKLYLKKYEPMHPALPFVVAEALLRSSMEMELPRWLIDSFKSKRSDMVGQESNPSSLLRLYVDYGRYVDATNLILEYLDFAASMRGRNIIKWKRPCSTWFPYTAIDTLWCRLEEQTASSQCQDMKKLFHGALLRHLNMLKVDSEDAHSYAGC